GRNRADLVAQSPGTDRRGSDRCVPVLWSVRSPQRLFPGGRCRRCLGDEDQPQWSIRLIEPARAATGSELVLDAPPIVSNVPGSFAWGVLHQRHPALIEQVRDAFPYPPDLLRGLDRLLEEIAGTIEALGHHAHDRQMWEAWGRD